MYIYIHTYIYIYIYIYIYTCIYRIYLLSRLPLLSDHLFSLCRYLSCFFSPSYLLLSSLSPLRQATCAWNSSTGSKFAKLGNKFVHRFTHSPAIAILSFFTCSPHSQEAASVVYPDLTKAVVAYVFSPFH